MCLFYAFYFFISIGKYAHQTSHTPTWTLTPFHWPACSHCRYDGRGHLHDLSEYDAEYSTWNRDYQLSEEEARIETLCDEERYLALHTDLLEDEARQGTAQEKLTSATNALKFFKYLKVYSHSFFYTHSFWYYLDSTQWIGKTGVFAFWEDLRIVYIELQRVFPAFEGRLGFEKTKSKLFNCSSLTVSYKLKSMFLSLP